MTPEIVRPKESEAKKDIVTLAFEGMKDAEGWRVADVALNQLKQDLKNAEKRRIYRVQVFGTVARAESALKYYETLCGFAREQGIAISVTRKENRIILTSEEAEQKPIPDDRFVGPRMPAVERARLVAENDKPLTPEREKRAPARRQRESPLLEYVLKYAKDEETRRIVLGLLFTENGYLSKTEPRGFLKLLETPERNALENVGCVGIMQLSAGVVEDVSYRTKAHITEGSDPRTDPEKAIRIAVEYVRILSKWADKIIGLHPELAGQKEQLIIAAYNCGLGRVEKLIERYGKDWASRPDKVDKKDRSKYIPPITLNYLNTYEFAIKAITDSKLLV